MSVMYDYGDGKGPVPMKINYYNVAIYDGRREISDTKFVLRYNLVGHNTFYMAGSDFEKWVVLKEGWQVDVVEH